MKVLVNFLAILGEKTYKLFLNTFVDCTYFPNNCCLSKLTTKYFDEKKTFYGNNLDHRREN